jgi:hypothetical protein
MVKSIEQAISKGDVSRLTEMREALIQDSELPNKNVLLKRITEALHRLTLSQFTLTFEQWQDLWTTVSIQFPRLTPLLKETLEPPRRKIVRSEDLTLVIYTTGSTPNSPVFLELSGGETALKLKEEITRHIGG